MDVKRCKKYRQPCRTACEGHCVSNLKMGCCRQPEPDSLTKVVLTQKLTRVSLLALPVYWAGAMKVIIMRMLGKVRRPYSRGKKSLHEIAKTAVLPRNRNVSGCAIRGRWRNRCTGETRGRSSSRRSCQNWNWPSEPMRIAPSRTGVLRRLPSLIQARCEPGSRDRKDSRVDLTSRKTLSQSRDWKPRQQCSLPQQCRTVRWCFFVASLMIGTSFEWSP